LISGFLCGIAGILMASRLTLGMNVVGQRWELITIAGVMKERGVCLEGSIHEKNFRYCEHYGHYIQLLIDRHTAWITRKLWLYLKIRS
jgi:hypothetical protein